MWFVKGQWGVLFGASIFMFQITFSSVGGCGGPEMFCGLEMIKLLCGCSVAYVDGLESGDPEMFCGSEMVKLLCGCSVAYVDGLGSVDGSDMLSVAPIPMTLSFHEV